MNRGAVFGLLSAALFGLSAPAAKLLLQDIGPWMLAGLLYLGSGVGLGLVSLTRRRLFRSSPTDTPLGRTDVLWLVGAIVSGGVAGPLFLMFGLATGSAAQSSLLLNLEGVFTALIAWRVFHEHLAPRVALGMGAIASGAVLLSWGGSVALDRAAVLVAGACLAWAVDNNLTRQVSGSDAVQIAALKGLAAGTVNVTIALAQAGQAPSVAAIAGGAVVGFFGYGVSLVLFVLALRHLGAARTGGYFATAPFVGAVVSVVLLGEPVSSALLVAGILMALGVWLHVSEHHAHAHAHEGMEHDHMHRHDDHHRHDHPADAPPGEPHAHRHVHTSVRHAHPHYPDLHHRHGHSR